ncbi:MAG: hypothetical protein LBR70_06810 [Lactobacillaceae bacterium]|jgi:hypothetical protein|nr:hypothetical protein [Lactobacillaceae bacterium]
MKKFFKRLDQILNNLTSIETEEEKAKREALRQECENFKFGRPVISDEQLKDLRSRILVQRANDCGIQYAIYGYPFCNIALFSFQPAVENVLLGSSWDVYLEEVSAEISRRERL